jgi:hypothetical protein
MASFSLTKLREIGPNYWFGCAFPGGRCAGLHGKGCYFPPLFLAERHSLATAPQPQPRSVPIARAKHKRQSHLNLFSQPLQWASDDKSTPVRPVREGFLRTPEGGGFRPGEFL